MSVITANMNQNFVANGQAHFIEDVAYDTLCESCTRARDPSSKEERALLSFEEISAAFEKCAQHLQRVECREELTRLLEQEHNVNITQCICLALGNFGKRPGEDIDFGEFTGPLHQLAVLTVLLQVLGTKHDIQNVYFQDPQFQPVEIQFLESLGYTVLDDPEAFDMMSASTFLFAPYCPDYVMCMALEPSSPALYVGNDPQQVGWNIMNRPDGPERARALQIDTFFRFDVSTKGNEPMMMPAFDQAEWLTRAHVRWLRPDYKKFEKAGPVVLFFLYRIFVFLFMVWKRIKSQYLAR